MKKLIFTALVAVLCLAACTATKPQQETVYTIDEVYEQAPSLLGDTILFQGVCNHLCKHGGRKAFLMGTKYDTVCSATDTVIRPLFLRVEGGKMGNFDAACINNIVRVKGVLHATELTAQPIADNPAEQHGADGKGCETEQAAIVGYFAEAISYTIITE